MHDRALKELHAKAGRQREALANTEALIAAITKLSEAPTNAPQTGPQGKQR